MCVIITCGFNNNLSSTDGCDTTSYVLLTSTTSLTLNWTESPLGKLLQIPCPCNYQGCDESSPQSATRLCTGNFSSESYWEEPNSQDCVFSKFTLWTCYTTLICSFYFSLAVGSIDSLGGNASVIVGQDITINFTLSGAYPVVLPENLQWSFTNEGQTTVIMEGNGKYSFSQSRLGLTISNCDLADAGRYTLTASNVAGMTTNFTSLTINSKSSQPQALHYLYN